MTHEPIAARPPSASYRLRLFLRRHRAAAAALLVVSLSILSALVVSLRFAWSESRARAREELEGYHARIAAADASLRVYDAFGARRHLQGAPASLRGWEWHFLEGRLDLARQVQRGPLARCDSLDWRGQRVVSSWYFPQGSYLTLHDGSSSEAVATSALLDGIATACALGSQGRVLFGSYGGFVSTWDPDADRVRELGRVHSGQVTALRWLDDQRALSSAMDGKLVLWQLSLGSSSILIESSAACLGMDLAPDGKRVALAGEDGRLRLLRLEGPSEADVVAVHASAVTAVAFEGSGDRLASGSREGRLRVWSAEGELIGHWSAHEGEIRSLAFLPDGNTLVSAAADRTLRLWDLGEQELVRVLHGHEHLVDCLDVADDGSSLVSGSFDGTLRFWDVEREPGLRRFEDHAGYVRDLAFSPDGRRLATASRDHTVVVRDLEDEGALTIHEHGDRVTSLAFDPDGTHLATACGDGRVRLFDLRSSELVAELDEHTGEAHVVAFSPDGTRLATGGRDGGVIVHDGRGLKAAARFELDGTIQRVSFDPKSGLLAAITNKRVLAVWSLERQALVWQNERPYELHDVAFAPDGERLAVGCGELDGRGRLIQFHDARDGRLAGELAGHTDIVLGVDWSPDGKRLASAAADGTVRLWDPRAMRELLVLRGHENWAWSVAFSPDGTRIASGGGDRSESAGVVLLWEALQTD